MNDFWCAQTASTEGHAEIIKTIYNSWCNTDQKQLLLSANKFICFRLALSGLKLDIMELLIFWSDPTTQQAMLAADDYFCFRFAADQGKLDILKKCFEWANDTNRVGMLKAKDFSACSSSAKSGNLEIMKQCLIWSSSLNLSSAVIEANDYVCFMAAAKCKKGQKMTKP